MGIGIHFDKDEDDYDGPLFGRNWLEDKKDEYDGPLFGRNWLEDKKDEYDGPILGASWREEKTEETPYVQEETESTTHPKNVNVGDSLRVLYKGELISVIVTDEPFEVDSLGVDDMGWWQCTIKYKNYPYQPCAVWCEENPVWEIGQD